MDPSDAVNVAQFPDEFARKTYALLDGILGAHVDYEFNGFLELSRGPPLALEGTFENSVS